MNDFAVLIAQHLKFDVPRIFDKTLSVNIGSAERLCASLRAVSYAARSSSCLRTTRIPRPPPPATAFKISGYPIFAASLASCFLALDRAVASRNRRQTSTLHFTRARSFSPIISIIFGRGPINVISEASQTLAKLAFSERNP